MEGVFINGYLGGVTSNLINKFITKKLGSKPTNFEVKNLSLDVKEKVTVNLSMEMSKEDFEKLMEVIV